MDKLTKKERAEENQLRERLHLLVKTGEFDRLRSRLNAEMAENPDAFEKKRQKYGFPLNEIVVLREMFREWEAATERYN